MSTIAREHGLQSQQESNPQVGAISTQVGLSSDLGGTFPSVSAQTLPMKSIESPSSSERARDVSISSAGKHLEFIAGEADEEEVTYDHFEDHLMQIMSTDGFRGGVKDYFVFDTSFRKRRSTIESSGLNSEKLGLDEEKSALRREGSYVEFVIELQGSSGVDVSLFLLRRFSDFEKFETNLRQALKMDGIQTPIPGLPAKQVFAFGGRWKERGFVEERRQLLDAWLRAVLLMQSRGSSRIKKAFVAFMSG